MTGHLRVLAATALLAATASTPPAHAAPGAGTLVIQGSGSISPGMDAVPNTLLPPPTHYFSFGGTATVMGTDGLVTYGCGFSGFEIGTWAGGVGALGGACGPITCQPLAWARAGAVAELTCTGPLAAARLECVFRPHQVPQVTSYDMTCRGEYARVTPPAAGRTAPAPRAARAGDVRASPTPG